MPDQTRDLWYAFVSFVFAILAMISLLALGAGVWLLVQSAIHANTHN